MSKRYSWLTVFSLACFCVLALIFTVSLRGSFKGPGEYEDPFVVKHVSASGAVDYWGIRGVAVGWWREEWSMASSSPKAVNRSLFGFGYTCAFRSHGNGMCHEQESATVPLWFVLLLTLILPYRWVWLTVYGRKDMPEHLCKVCHYDLRAHSPGQRWVCQFFWRRS